MVATIQESITLGISGGPPTNAFRVAPPRYHPITPHQRIGFVQAAVMYLVFSTVDYKEMDTTITATPDTFMRHSLNPKP